MLFLLALLGCESEPKRTLGSDTTPSSETVKGGGDKSVQLKFDPFSNSSVGNRRCTKRSFHI